MEVNKYNLGGLAPEFIRMLKGLESEVHREQLLAPIGRFNPPHDFLGDRMDSASDDYNKDRRRHNMRVHQTFKCQQNT